MWNNLVALSSLAFVNGDGTIYTVDPVPTLGSDNLVKSGGVYDALTQKFDKSGGTITGEVDMSGYGIHNLHDPVLDMDAVNKRYVDRLLEEITQKLEDLEDKLSELEDPGQGGDSHRHRFLITFESLEGLELINGIWNAEEQRLEC